MTEKITFFLDGAPIEAAEGETIWRAAKRAGVAIPHLCHKDASGYRADGNCRACMVEIEGERVLAASCIRKPEPGMKVSVTGDRATGARKSVIELLAADQTPREASPDRNSHFWAMAEAVGVADSRYPARRKTPLLDDSHLAMSVNLEACIECGLCVRACREVQVNGVIGMAGRGAEAKIVFDMDDPMGDSSCVACGECVQACPTGALSPASLLQADGTGDSRAFDREETTVCPYCGVGCQLSLKIAADTETGRDRIAYVTGAPGPANASRLCVKGRFGFDYVQSPERLTKPLIRREGAAKGLDVDPANPLTHFREASWEEALDRAAQGLKRAAAQGGRRVAGFGSAKCSNEEAYLFQKLIRQAFGHNNVDHCTRLCHASSVAALMEGVGSAAVTATFNEIENADCAIVIGANPAENHPVAASFFKQFAERGGELIVLDPRGGALAAHASQRVQFRPGADVALLNAVAHVLLNEDLIDRDFIAARTEGFEAFAQHLSAFSPEEMAPVCGVEPQQIRRIARAYGTAKAAMIFWGMGVSQSVHGTDNARCLIALALMTGHVGRPGAGLHPLRGQNNVQGASDAGLIPMVLPDYAKVADAEARAKFEALWGSAIDPEPGLTVVEIIDAAYNGDITAMYVMGENPAMSDPDLAHARAALAKLEHLVVQDIFLTETACFADVVLPAAAWPEKCGTVTNTNRQVQMGRKALRAPGEARPDLDITIAIARRLGLDWSYTHPRDVFGEMSRAMPSLAHISWDRLEAAGAVTYPSLSPTDPGQPVVFSETFPRDGGKALFVPAEVTAPVEPPDEDYPFILVTGRQLEHWHTGAMTRRASVLDALEPSPTASLHPSSLAKLGLAPGGRLEVSTRRGSIQLSARVDRGVAPGMVFIPFAYREAAANLLTNPQLDPFGKIPGFKYSAARVTAL